MKAGRETPFFGPQPSLRYARYDAVRRYAKGWKRTCTAVIASAFVQLASCLAVLMR